MSSDICCWISKPSWNASGSQWWTSRLCVCAMITDLLFKCMSSHGQDGQNTRLGKVPTMLYFDGSTVYSSNFDWLSLRRIHSIILDPIMYSSEWTCFKLAIAAYANTSHRNLMMSYSTNTASEINRSNAIRALYYAAHLSQNGLLYLMCIYDWLKAQSAMHICPRSE